MRELPSGALDASRGAGVRSCYLCVLDKHLGSLPERVRRKITHDNAAALYDLPQRGG